MNVGDVNWFKPYNACVRRVELCLTLIMLLSWQAFSANGMTEDLKYVSDLGIHTEITTADFKFDPPSVEQLVKNRRTTVKLNITRGFFTKMAKAFNNNNSYYLHIISQHFDIAYPFPGEQSNYKIDDTHTGEIVLDIVSKHGHMGTFGVTGIHVGRTTFFMHLLIFNETDYEDTLALDPYGVSIVRRQRMVDVAFNAILSVITLLNSYAVGCLTDLSVVKKHFQKPLLYRVILGVCSQFMVMPLLAFSLAQILSNLEPQKLDNNLALGLLFVSCIPGGGMGHLLVIIIGNADKELSMVMNLFSTTLVIVVAPIWVYTLGHFFPNLNGVVQFPFLLMEASFIAVIIPYLLGVLTFYCKPTVAEAMLTWVVKPLLLLVAILFITLGIYINMYMFDIIDRFAVIAGITLPFLGFGVGGFLAIIARQKKPVAKTLATETALSNCALALLTLRFSLQQPDADVISTMPMWVLLFSPLPFVLLLIVHKIKKSIMDYYNKRKETQEQHMMLLASFANMTKNMADISGLSQIFGRKEKTEENGAVDPTQNGERRESNTSEDGTIGEEPSTAQSML